MKYVIRLVLFAIVSLSIALGSAFTWLCYAQARTLVLPPRSMATQTPADYGVPVYQDVTFTTSDGLQVGGWYVPPTRADGASIIFGHGHLGNRSHFLGRIKLFSDYGYGMLLLEMRNSGTSEGNITTMGLLEALDVQAGFDFLTQQPEVNADRIAIYGHSMGGATVIRAFRRIPQARVLIAEASYASFEDNLRIRIAQDYPFPPLMFPQMVIGFSNMLTGENFFEIRPIDDIQQLEGRPVLLIHGTADRVVPFVNAENLYAAASEPKQLWAIENGQHMGSFNVSTTDYQAYMIPFLEQYLVNE